MQRSDNHADKLQVKIQILENKYCFIYIWTDKNVLIRGRIKKVTEDDISDSSLGTL